MPEPLNLTVSLRGTRDVSENYQVFRLAGLLDAFSEPVFKKILAKFAEDGPPYLILDLSAIDFVDSSGLGALVQLHKKAVGANGSLQIISNTRVTQTVRMGRLEQFLSIRPSIDEAITHIPAK
ncbi:MAG: STAS domain-containing protein [Anaerolineae bacterium]|nr:STAS domain-containing protein [Gloeobacterales cyanobacterium ES-bin-313]